MSLVTSTPAKAKARDPLNRAFYLPRLSREFYQADAVVHWTLTIFDRQQGWLTEAFHPVPVVRPDFCANSTISRQPPFRPGAVGLVYRIEPDNHSNKLQISDSHLGFTVCFWKKEMANRKPLSKQRSGVF